MKVPSLQMVRRFVGAVRSYAHVKHPILLANASLDYESLIHKLDVDGLRYVLEDNWTQQGYIAYLESVRRSALSSLRSSRPSRWQIPSPRVQSLRLRMALVLKPRSPPCKAPSSA